LAHTYRKQPSAARFMARAFLPSRGNPGTVPPLALRWQGLTLDRPASVLWPHAAGFALHMALLTQRDYPLPIWNALQVRNRLVRHRRMEPAMAFDVETAVHGQRIVEKGIEVDVRTTWLRADDLHWESEVTYFYRGRFGAATAEPAASPPLDRCAPVAQFALPRGERWRFARLTGDYNGIHQWDWYARRLGFRGAFLHPQRAAALCLEHVGGRGSERQALDLWLKGPAYYGEDAVLIAAQEGPAIDFGLRVGAEPRPAIVGRWRDL
jgi:hypothetical protein